MQSRLGGQTKPADVPGVRRNLRFNQNDVKHPFPSFRAKLRNLSLFCLLPALRIRKAEENSIWKPGSHENSKNSFPGFLDSRFPLSYLHYPRNSRLSEFARDEFFQFHDVGGELADAFRKFFRCHR